MARLSVKWATNGDQKAMWSLLIFAALKLCKGWDSCFWEPCVCGLSWMLARSVGPMPQNASRDSYNEELTSDL
jgi:hypothetical protein